MKKILFAIAILVGICSTASAFEFGANRAYDKQHLRYKVAVAAHLSTSTLIVDLSNTTNWPHKRTGEIHVYNVRLNIDKTAASTTTVKLGVVTLSSTTAGDVTWFLGAENERNVSNTLLPIYVTSDLVYNLKVVPSATMGLVGSTPYILSNDKTTTSTAYQNDVKIPSTTGTLTIPAAGDLIMLVSNGAVAVEVYLELDYSGEN